MIAHDTGRGRKAFDGIDVERLFAAIRMLADRESLEIAPFVATWNANLDTLGESRRLPPFWASEFMKAIRDERARSQLERSFSEGVRALEGRKDLRSTFARLQDEMIAALASILTVDPSRVDYLAPVLADVEEQLQVASLNYDLSVEHLAERADTTFDTGIEGWRGGYQWRWKSGVKLRLLKLHGSLNWYFGNDDHPGKLTSDVIRLATDMSGDERKRYQNRLALVFGQGAKLRSDGPFLAMLLEFDKFLERTDHLVVVGYSFRDDHINAAVRRWFNKRQSPRVTIINPDLDDWRRSPDAPPFFHELYAAMRAEGAASRDPVLKPGFALRTTTAGKGLIETFGEGPRLRRAGAAPLQEEVQ